MTCPDMHAVTINPGNGISDSETRTKKNIYMLADLSGGAQKEIFLADSELLSHDGCLMRSFISTGWKKSE